MTFLVPVLVGWAVAWTVLWTMDAWAAVQSEMRLNREVLNRTRN